MDINWLIDFVCLGRTLNFSRAAEERNVTQSAFSRRIKSLESWVGHVAHRPVELSGAADARRAAVSRDGAGSRSPS